MPRSHALVTIVKKVRMIRQIREETLYQKVFWA